MSDLERVRETARVGDWEAFDAELDAHLKEDATNRKRYRAQEIEANTRRNKAEAERDRLREENERLRGQVVLYRNLGGFGKVEGSS